MTDTIPPPPTDRPLQEVAASFIRLGFTAFGGPAAHIAMFQEEFVKRRKWLSEQHFLDLLGATNLIPGPNSTEMAMHIGMLRAGWLGLIVGGAAFILPAALLVGILSWFYVTYSALPAVGWLLYGIKPVVVAVILQAIYSLGMKAAKSWFYVALGAAVFALALLGIGEIPLLFGGALLAMLVMNGRKLLTITRGGTPLMLPLFLQQPAAQAAVTAAMLVPFSLGELFLTFLKIGGVIYGSGYVLLAFLETEFVQRLGWLTNQQLLDAVAIGQFTPGPVFTTATFVGYVLGGVPGAALATLGIFLPGFIFVAIIHPLVPRIRQSSWLSALLDGVNMAAIGLMAAVTVQIAQAALVDWVTIALAIAAAVLLIRFKINSTWLIIGGGIVGVVYQLLIMR
ncbi:MAG: chromate efflux transporter [Chloroflexota bacterium]|nr:chromate efflux transporter [Chloroflexota bacterium]